MGLGMLGISGWGSNSGFCCCSLQPDLLSSLESDLLGWHLPSKVALLRPQNPFLLAVQYKPLDFMPSQVAYRLQERANSPLYIYIYKQKAVCLAGMTVKLYQNVDDELCDVKYIFA